MKITLTKRRWDRHAHARDAQSGIMGAVVPHHARQFHGTMWMPNTNPFLTTTELARNYRRDLRKFSADIRSDFQHLIAGYLTEDMDPELIERGYASAAWQAMKVYPKGATTNSHGGVRVWENLYPRLERMEKIGMPVLFHGEVNVLKSGKVADPFDRERIFMDTVLPEIRQRFPNLKISLEHITTGEAVDQVLTWGGPLLVATVCFQHIMFDRTDLLGNGPIAEMFCFPIHKRREDMEAIHILLHKNTSWVGLGSDSAPHPTTAKERQCGCAGGVWGGPALLEWYAMAFEQIGALHAFENFVCSNGLHIFGFKEEPADDPILLSNEGEPWTMRELVQAGQYQLHPFGYSKFPEFRRNITWRIS